MCGFKYYEFFNEQKWVGQLKKTSSLKHKHEYSTHNLGLFMGTYLQNLYTDLEQISKSNHPVANKRISSFHVFNAGK